MLQVLGAACAINHGVKTVAVAGTDEPLSGSDFFIYWLVVQAQTDNTGFIAVGAVGVDATEATGNGVLLDAGDSIALPVKNLADIYLDATVSGDGVRYIYGVKY